MTTPQDGGPFQGEPPPYQPYGQYQPEPPPGEPRRRWRIFPPRPWSRRRKVITSIVGAVLALWIIGAALGSPSEPSSPVAAPSTVAPAAPSSASASAVPVSSPRPAAGCDASLWKHIYHAYRLHVIARCKTVTGTVAYVKREPDGDLHIDLKADDSSVINSGNISGEHGYLVLEAICVGTVTQADAVDACHDVNSHVTVPGAGDRIRVTGSYVLDADHGWMEIHPISRLTVLSHTVAPVPVQSTHAPSPSPSPTHVISSPTQAHVSCYPQTNGGNCYEPGEYCRESDAGTYGVAGDGQRIYCTTGRPGHWEAA